MSDERDGEETDEQIDAAFEGIADQGPGGAGEGADAVVTEESGPLGKALDDAPTMSAQGAGGEVSGVEAESLGGVELSDEVHREEHGWLQEADDGEGLTADDDLEEAARPETGSDDAAPAGDQDGGEADGDADAQDD